VSIVTYFTRGLLSAYFFHLGFTVAVVTLIAQDTTAGQGHILFTEVKLYSFRKDTLILNFIDTCRRRGFQ